MYYLRDERNGQYVSGMVKLRGADAYAVYFKNEPSSGARWASEKGAQDARTRLLDCEYTNPPGAAAHLAVVDPDEKDEVAPMNEMMNAQAGTPARSLLEIETEIRHQKNVIGEGYVKIGLALIEAKKQLSHGEWAGWLRDRVNFSQSSAEGYMRVAREYGTGSQLLNLPYTKVLALLSVPAEERETFAEDNQVEDKSVSEIKQLIRERDEARKAAEEAKQSAREQMDRADGLYKRMRDAEEHAKAEKRDQERLTLALNREREHVAQLMSREPDTVTVEKEVPPADYELIKTQLKNTREMLEETEDELAQAQVERDMAMQELEAEKMNGSDPLDITPFREACTHLLNKLVAAPVAGDFFRTKTDFELEQYSNIITLVMDWSVRSQDVIENIRNERAGFNGPFEIAL